MLKLQNKSYSCETIILIFYSFIYYYFVQYQISYSKSAFFISRHRIAILQFLRFWEGKYSFLFQ